MELYTPDRTDRKILMQLQMDARLTYKELASILHLSKSAIQERVKRLEELGFISAIVALVNPNKFEQCMVTYLQIKLTIHTVHALESFRESVGKFEEVRECYHTTGGFDFMLKVVTSGMMGYNIFLTKKLGFLDNILTVNSSLVINEFKRETAIPL
jgi:Lrp/AsnC family leucine-responsive transcriptional regulator